MPSRCIFFFSTLRAWSTLLSRTSTCTRRSSLIERLMGPTVGGPMWVIVRQAAYRCLSFLLCTQSYFTSAVERTHSALLGGCGLLVILGRVASRVCRMVPGKSSTGSFAVGKHHNRRCRCQQWAIRYSSRGTPPRSADR